MCGALPAPVTSCGPVFNELNRVDQHATTRLDESLHRRLGIRVSILRQDFLPQFYTFENVRGYLSEQRDQKLLHSLTSIVSSILKKKKEKKNTTTRYFTTPIAPNGNYRVCVTARASLIIQDELCSLSERSSLIESL